MNRTGFHIQAAFLNPDQKRTCIEVHRQYRPAVALVMDGPDLAQALLEATNGETLIVHRRYHPQDASFHNLLTPDEMVDFATDGLSKTIWVQIENEPTPHGKELAEMLAWQIKVGEELQRRGYHGVLGNIGPACYEPAEIDSGIFREYLQALAAWSVEGLHYAGYHEYTGILLPFGVGEWSQDCLLDPTCVQPDKWPIMSWVILECAFETYRDQLDYDHHWHLMRSHWFNFWAESMGIGTHKIILTEFGFDRMPDLTNQPNHIYQRLEAKWGAANGFSELRGPLTYQKVWQAYFPQWTFVDALHAQNVWFEREAPDNYVGWAWFTWCFDAAIPKEQNWEHGGYNVGKLDHWHRRLIIERTPPGPSPIPNPTPEPEPIPVPVPTPTPSPWQAVFEIIKLAGAMVLDLIASNLKYLLALVIGAIVAVFLGRLNSQTSGGVQTVEMDIIPITVAFEMLVAAVAAILSGALVAPVTEPLVNLAKWILKKVGLETAVSGDVLALLVAGVVTIGIWVARHTGIEIELNNFFNILATVIPGIIALLSMFTGQRVIYSLSAKHRVPLFGYRRSA